MVKVKKKKKRRLIFFEIYSRHGLCSPALLTFPLTHIHGALGYWIPTTLNWCRLLSDECNRSGESSRVSTFHRTVKRCFSRGLWIRGKELWRKRSTQRQNSVCHENVFFFALWCFWVERFHLVCFYMASCDKSLILIQDASYKCVNKTILVLRSPLIKVGLANSDIVG